MKAVRARSVFPSEDAVVAGLKMGGYDRPGLRRLGMSIG